MAKEELYKVVLVFKGNEAKQMRAFQKLNNDEPTKVIQKRLLTSVKKTLVNKGLKPETLKFKENGAIDFSQPTQPERLEAERLEEGSLITDRAYYNLDE